MEPTHDGLPTETFCERFQVLGLRWENIAIEFPDPCNLTIKAPKVVPVTLHFSDFGLADDRGLTEANTLWRELYCFALEQGTRKYDPAIKKRVSLLRIHLKKFFGISRNPIPHRRRASDGSRNAYETVFQITLINRGWR